MLFFWWKSQEFFLKNISLYGSKLKLKAVDVVASKKCREVKNQHRVRNETIAAACELENEQSRHVIYSNYTALITMHYFLRKRVHYIESGKREKKGIKIRLSLSILAVCACRVFFIQWQF